MMTRWKHVVCALLALCLTVSCSRQSTPTSAAATAKSSQRIFTALILATNGKQTLATPDELTDYADRMRHVFGYRNFKLLGQSMKTMDDSADNRWLIPGKDFSVRLTSRKKMEDAYLLELELYKRQRLLVDTSAKLAPSSPLFIRAPMSREGQLIVMLQVK
jgi:hypothetical protein